MGTLLLTYIWRFHDLTPALSRLRLAALATVATWLVLLLQPRPKTIARAFESWGIRLLFVWSVWIGIGLVGGVNFDDTYRFISQDHIKALVAVLFIVGTLRTFSNIEALALTHLAGASVVGLYYAKGGFGTWRSPVPMYDVNDMALLFGIALPFAFYAATVARGSATRTGAWALALLIAMSIAATRSRGGFLTLAVVAAFLLFRFGNVSLWKRVVPVVLAIVGLLTASEEARNRLGTIFALEQDYNLTESEGRIAIWTRGLGYMASHPLFGLGAANFQFAEREFSGARGMVAHNSYVEVAAETGVVGIALFVAMLAATFVGLVKARRRFAKIPGTSRQLAMCDACTAALLAWCFGAFFLAWGYSVILYTLVTMSAALAAVSRNTAGPPQVIAKA